MNQDNNFNQNNFNTQGNNGIPNNQSLNNQGFNQNMNVNQPIFNPQPINNTVDTGNASNQNFNSKPPKKMNLGLIIGIVVGVIAIGIGAFMLFGNNDSKTNISSNDNDNSSNVDITYYDASRELKDTYTFKEAVSKFAFKVKETTLIFEENEKIVLDSIINTNTIYDESRNPQFAYKHDSSSIVYTLYLGESSSSNLEDFVDNFKKGVLSDKTEWEVENINIIESGEDYVFASWQKMSLSKDYEYYFAKKVGNNVFYSYKNNLTQFTDKQQSLILNGFKELFDSLSIDDENEPYIYDKIMNVPIVLNKKIMNYNSIFSISNSQMISELNSDYIDGSVSFNYNDDYINLKYGATGYYNKINWTKNLDSTIKYFNEDDEIIIGVKDDNLTQVFDFDIYSNTPITNVDEFNNYINKVLNRN